MQTCLPAGLSVESAGCEALRAEQVADDIRSALLPGAKRPATTSKCVALSAITRLSNETLIKK